jgi:hypothetical protein
MEKHYNSIVRTMPKKDEEIEGEDAPSVPFTITLPANIIPIIVNDVGAARVWGGRRATICANLILDMLKRLDHEGTITLPKVTDRRRR